MNNPTQEDGDYQLRPSVAEMLIAAHNASCEAACDAQRPNERQSGGCGYQRHDGSKVYPKRCPTCPRDWMIDVTASIVSLNQALQVSGDSGTPRTDQQAYLAEDMTATDYVVTADFSRQLERENVELRALLLAVRNVTDDTEIHAMIDNKVGWSGNESL